MATKRKFNKVETDPPSKELQETVLLRPEPGLLSVAELKLSSNPPPLLGPSSRSKMSRLE